MGFALTDICPIIEPPYIWGGLEHSSWLQRFKKPGSSDKGHIFGGIQPIFVKTTHFQKIC